MKRRIALLILWLLSGCARDRGPPCYTKDHLMAAGMICYLGGLDEGKREGEAHGYKQAQMDILGYVPDTNERNYVWKN